MSDVIVLTDLSANPLRFDRVTCQACGGPCDYRGPGENVEGHTAIAYLQCGLCRRAWVVTAHMRPCNTLPEKTRR